ncbi:MAG: thioredoxin domain-containing protein [Aquificaceae bacterium]|nr:thioredoxin domain-containing protein [Aquificaceae bacterium]
MKNRLSNSKSPYLQKSAHQPVDWYEWSEEAFEKAKKEDKPILLSVGGVWCHWCHVMAHESFENPEIAKIINENFVPIKVDRDERPDIDRRYQESVMAMGSFGGWPLTVFLTPEGKAFFGGTYFPPEDRWQRPGFKSLLLKIASLWKEDRERILRYADGLYNELSQLNSNSYKDYVDESLLNVCISNLLRNIDYTYGGIGEAPKFHHAKAFELLIYHYYFNKSEPLKKAVESSLDAMAKGGVYDHLLGGFFRYSTDEKWHIPHFEKMLYDNAELLGLYSLAYKVFGKELYKRTAQGILNYYKNYAYDQKGGFYASQDADIGLLDEGGYYTFTYDEIERILSKDELELARLYFGFASMPHERDKLVLYINKEEEEIARETGLEIQSVVNTIQSIKTKLLLHREKREKPYIDKSIYTNWNALMISAMCDYWKVFNDEDALIMAVKTADRILREHYRNGVLYHREGVKGYSEDYIFFSEAMLKLFEITQESAYLEISKEVMERAIELFWDEKGWGFYDSSSQGDGLLSVRLKNLQDTPTQSANGSAPYVLLLLGSLTDQVKFIDHAEKTLQSFSQIVRKVPTISFSYAISLYAYLNGIYKVETEAFFYEALSLFKPFKFVVRAPVDGVVVCIGQSCKKYESVHQILTLTH